MKPILITPWCCPARLLEASLRRNRPQALGYEWWVLNRRYPGLGAKDGVSDVRRIQNLCNEMGLRFWQTDPSVAQDQLLRLWATESGALPEQAVITVPDDAAPNYHSWVEALEVAATKSDRPVITAKRGLGGRVISWSKIGSLGNCSVVTVNAIPTIKNEGGPASKGGVWPDSLYDETPDA